MLIIVKFVHNFAIIVNKLLSQLCNVIPYILVLIYIYLFLVNLRFYLNERIGIVEEL